MDCNNPLQAIAFDPFRDHCLESSASVELDDFVLRHPRRRNALKMMTVDIIQTYRQIRSDVVFEYETQMKRILTSPGEGKEIFNTLSAGVYNDGRDNSENHLIVCVDDEIQTPKEKYTIIEMLGQGISSQVFKVKRDSDGQLFALKVIKNKKVYRTQSLMELKILDYLNNIVDKDDQYHIIRVIEYFSYHEHLCLVFELLNSNLIQLLQRNNLEGISLTSLRKIAKQILIAVDVLHKVNLIHCDLKPENILLKINEKNPRNMSIKLIDFGSSCYTNHTHFSYLQARNYRSPEVIIGIKYSTEIDIWSLGCIFAELFLGKPLISGLCEYDQLCRIEALFGEIPLHMIIKGRYTKKYYKIDNKTNRLKLKSEDEFTSEFPNSQISEDLKTPFGIRTLDDLININRKKTKREEIAIFIHFLKGLLTLDPNERWTAEYCLHHPFIQEEDIPMCIPQDERIQSYDRSFQSELGNRFPIWGNYNSSAYNSMIIPTNYMNNSFSPMNSSYEGTSVYQPNIAMIPMGWVKNFQFAKVNEIDLNPNKKSCGKSNKNRKNNSYMMMSFEKIQSSSTKCLTSDFYRQSQLERNVNDDKGNKYTMLNQMPRKKTITGQGNIKSSFWKMQFANQSNETEEGRIPFQRGRSKSDPEEIQLYEANPTAYDVKTSNADQRYSYCG